VIRHVAALLLAALLGACDDGGGPPTFTGYAEADEVVVAAPSAGWLETVLVREGDEAKPGQPLFRLDATEERAAKAAAEAALAQARADLADLRKGEREQTIAMIEAELRDARARLQFAESELERQRTLVQRAASDRRSLDQAQRDVDTLQAQVARLEAQLDLAQLPAREDRIAAQEALVRRREAELAQAEWQLSQRTVEARVTGRVEEVVREAGEWAPASGPVLRLLPPDSLKIRFFVPQAMLSRLELGETVRAACDACPDLIEARISFIASDAEYTPPVIFSIEARQKLVYLVEARPAPGSGLRPGQPVDVAVPAS
jgi:HlyD family secretion protein